MILRAFDLKSHDFRPKLFDTKFNYHFIKAILKAQNSVSQYLFDPVVGLMTRGN